MVKLSGISISFGEKQVLKDFDLTVEPGQRIALMGPSGCGKTTVLRILLGLLNPQKGTVENRFSKTAVVFQEPRLLPWRTAAENVNLVLGDKRSTLPEAQRWLEQLGLGDAGNKYPGELSGGMQQRVALARALVMEAELLVLDEPFKGLDEALRQRMLELVDRQDSAMILVTHDEAEAQALGCKILRM